MWIDPLGMLVSSNLTAPPFIYYIQCYKIVLMFYNESLYAITRTYLTKKQCTNITASGEMSGLILTQHLGS